MAAGTTIYGIGVNGSVVLISKKIKQRTEKINNIKIIFLKIENTNK